MNIVMIVMNIDYYCDKYCDYSNEYSVLVMNIAIIVMSMNYAGCAKKKITPFDWIETIKNIHVGALICVFARNSQKVGL